MPAIDSTTKQQAGRGQWLEHSSYILQVQTGGTQSGLFGSASAAAGPANKQTLVFVSLGTSAPPKERSAVRASQTNSMGLDLGFVFRANVPHSCGKDNALHQQRLDELMTVIQNFLQGDLDNVAAAAARLPSALGALRSTELWQRYAAPPLASDQEMEAAVETIANAASVPVFAALGVQASCAGCNHLRSCYAYAPQMTIECLRETFEVPLRAGNHPDEALGERSFEDITKELGTAVNIARHVSELLQ